MEIQSLQDTENSRFIPVGETQNSEISIEYTRTLNACEGMQSEQCIEETEVQFSTNTNHAIGTSVYENNSSNLTGFIEEFGCADNELAEPDEKFEPTAKMMKLNDGSIRTQEFAVPNPGKLFATRLEASQCGLTPITETDRDNFSTMGKENNPISQFGKKRNYQDYTSENQNPNTANVTRNLNRPHIPLKRQLETFFSRRSTEVSSPPKPQSKVTKLSKPRSPNFKTKDRLRPSSLLSTEELILKEMESHRQKRRQELGIQRGRTTSRTLTSESAIGEQQIGNEVPRNSTGSSSVNKLTCIQPFSFELEKRSRLKSKGSREKSEEDHKFKASPVPTYNFFEVKKSHQPCIIPKEPMLKTQIRGDHRRQELTEQLKKEENMLRMQRNFKANEIPDYSKLAREGINQHVQPLQKTCPVTIKFHTDQRVSLRPSVSCENYQEDHSKQKFKALPVPNLSRVFKPIIPKSETIEVRAFELQCEKRAKERKEFDENFKKKELEQQKQREEEKRKKEEEDIKELRKKLVFRAAPIRNYPKIEIKKSEKPLVHLQAPKLVWL